MNPSAASRTPLDCTSVGQVRAALLQRHEIALIDAREEDPFAQCHPLFAAQMALSRIELDAPWRLPRLDVPVVVYDDGEGLAPRAARRLRELGYRQVSLLEGALAAWRQAGYETFRDVNAPSKAFGELVEHERHTPSLSADEVKALLDARADVVVLDARRFDEYQTMCIPGGTSVPGAELALRVRALAPNPATRVIVNCAGRTRSIIGTQSLVNFGIPNPVAALRNGTIGWTLAGFTLDHGQQRRAMGPVDEARRAAARARAQALATQAGARRVTMDDLPALAAPDRTLYRYDVRQPEEYAAGHLAGFGSAPGGQLVQETDVYAAVRGARLVLADDDGVRAPMTAHWLAQMGWEVYWLDGVALEARTARGAWPVHAPGPGVPLIDVEGLADGLESGECVLLDLAPGAQHVKRHIPGAWWVLRSQWREALPRVLAQAGGRARRIVITCAEQGVLARHVAAEIGAELAAQAGPERELPVLALDGGNAAWFASGRPAAHGEDHLASPRIDRYRRPYEGTDAPRAAMQAYLDWEFGLVAQLGRDGTHGFRVLRAA